MKEGFDRKVTPFVVGVLALAVIFSAFSDDSSLSGKFATKLSPGGLNISSAGSATGVQAQPYSNPGVNCGDVITKNTILINNLLDCINNGLIIGANNIELNCNGHKIDGTFKGGSKGVDINGKNGVIIKNCKITDFSNGISLEHSNGSYFEGNVFENNDFSGIYIERGSDNKIKNNLFNDTEFGIQIGSSDFNEISFNIFENNDLGIWMGSSLNNTISDNTFSNNDYALNLKYSSNNYVENNIANNNHYPFYLEGGSNNYLNNNYAENSKLAFYLKMSVDNHLINNVAINNGGSSDSSGFYLDNSPNNYLEHNVAYNSTYMNGGFGFYLNRSDNVVLIANNISEGKDYFDAAFFLTNVFNVTIERCNVKEYTKGIDGRNVSNSKISKNTFESTKLQDYVILFRGGQNNILNYNYFTETGHILLDETEKNSIIENILMNPHGGIYLHYSDDNLISKNKIFNNAIFSFPGISLDNSHNNYVGENNMNNVSRGLSITYISLNLTGNNCTNNTFANNVIKNTRYHAVYFVGLRNSVIKNNTVGDINGSCIILHLNENNLVYKNILENCQGRAGISVETKYDINNVFWENQFINNSGYNAYESYSQSKNYWNITGIGNYWDDFASNPGYPNYYEISGIGSGIDWHPQ